MGIRCPAMMSVTTAGAEGFWHRVVQGCAMLYGPCARSLIAVVLLCTVLKSLSGLCMQHCSRDGATADKAMPLCALFCPVFFGSGLERLVTIFRDLSPLYHDCNNALWPAAGGRNVSV